ncbi:MAG: hypothetical protein BWZ02_01650 [Lentisphaerae bacterium ADurb.BinA184]|nr:MAG: hypothetical protein BWZ02_01650 [Lentisphaerae bacterium ADurb.BinA184]
MGQADGAAPAQPVAVDHLQAELPVPGFERSARRDRQVIRPANRADPGQLPAAGDDQVARAVHARAAAEIGVAEVDRDPVGDCHVARGGGPLQAAAANPAAVDIHNQVAGGDVEDGTAADLEELVDVDRLGDARRRLVDRQAAELSAVAKPAAAVADRPCRGLAEFIHVEGARGAGGHGGLAGRGPGRQPAWAGPGGKLVMADEDADVAGAVQVGDFEGGVWLGGRHPGLGGVLVVGVGSLEGGVGGQRKVGVVSQRLGHVEKAAVFEGLGGVDRGSQLAAVVPGVEPVALGDVVDRAAAGDPVGQVGGRRAHGPVGAGGEGGVGAAHVHGGRCVRGRAGQHHAVAVGRHQRTVPVFLLAPVRRCPAAGPRPDDRLRGQGQACDDAENDAGKDTGADDAVHDGLLALSGGEGSDKVRSRQASFDGWGHSHSPSVWGWRRSGACGVRRDTGTLAEPLPARLGGGLSVVRTKSPRHGPCARELTGAAISADAHVAWARPAPTARLVRRRAPHFARVPSRGTAPPPQKMLGPKQPLPV